MNKQLEEKFFKTFDILPEYTYTVKDTFYVGEGHIYSASKEDIIKSFPNERYKVIKIDKNYPTITDYIFLELIALALYTYDGTEVYFDYSLEKIKEKTLKLLILAEYDVYSRVRKLFKVKEVNL